jgi:hypothetical protein
MDRKAALLLVSRALALIQGVCALIETSYLPERLYSYLHYAHQVAQVSVPVGSLYLPSLYRVEVAFLFLRILIYLVLAVVFWNCAPWVENTLLPERVP